MYNISHKYKASLLFLIKLVIVLSAIYFIYKKLVTNQLLSFADLQQQLSILFSENIWILILLLLFTDANWLLEVYKWKILSSVEKHITFSEAFQQSFASLTASIITPNRIGEYGVKALYFEKKSRKKIVALNFLGNMSQLAITVIFGLIGVVFILSKYNLKILAVNEKKLLLIFLFIGVLFFGSKKLGFTKIFSLYVAKITTFFKGIPKSIYLKTIGLALMRYLVFSHQFYFLVRIFKIEADYLVVINLIFCVYFIASIIPSLAIFDWAIKGSVAVFIFSFIEINELTIITITTIMWLLNFAIPALFGSIFVLNFKLMDTK
ncbi:hypothetical protein [Lutibacter sp.]